MHTWNNILAEPTPHQTPGIAGWDFKLLSRGGFAAGACFLSRGVRSGFPEMNLINNPANSGCISERKRSHGLNAVMPWC